MDEKLVIEITAEIDGLKKEVEEAKKQIEKFSKEGKTSLEDFNKSFDKFADVAKKGLAVAGAAIAGITTALIGSVSATEEYRTAMAKLNTSFEASGKTAETAKQTYNDLYRVLGDTDVAVEAANHLAQLSIGQEELAEYTSICQGIYATFGDSLPIEGLTEAINHTAKLGEVQGTLADALEWSGISVDDFNAKLALCSNEAEREALIRNTLNGIYDEASQKYEENAEALLKANEAQAKLDEATAMFGETMAPIVADLQLLLADILAQLAPYLQEFAETYMPKIREVLADVGTKIGECITWIADNWDLISTIGTTLLVIAAAIAAVSTAMSIAQFIMEPLNLKITLIIAVIGVLIATIIACVKHWDEIKEAISNFCKKAAEAVSNFVKSIGDFFTNLWNKITTTVSNIKESVVNKFEEIKTGISNKINAVKEGVVNTFNNIKDSMKNKITEAKTAVLNVFDNIKSGIKEKIENAKDTVKNVIDAIKGFFNFQFTWPKIPMPHFGISPAGWTVGDLLKGSIPKLSISWYAQGGVFDNPTLFGYGNGMLGGLGENGAEAVVPLEKNTEWLDKIADRLASRQANTPVVIEVDGSVFGKTAISTINNRTRQTGKLELLSY